MPADPLVLYDKLLVPVGCLAACLIDALWQRFARGQPGQLDHLDVGAALPESVKQQLDAPISTNAHTTELPTFDATFLETF